ncbi:MAG TPA: hypothetical protein VLW54_05150 [Candidatus Acidoferrales bacterium]|nr:hypothetical protein [Candidatus Acidoferrales bacterium]
MLLQFLSTVPFSRVRPGFTQLVLRAVDMAEPPIIERDLRSAPAQPGAIAESLGESLQMDSALELEAWWDLWVFDIATGLWAEQPQRLEILCHAPEFEDGMWRDAGHFSAGLGFEHLFTGHAGLLGNGGSGPAGRAAPQHPAEEEFLRRMTDPARLHEYAERTRENIRRLHAWMQRIAEELPLAPQRGIVLASEGEEDFEARLDAIETQD